MLKTKLIKDEIVEQVCNDFTYNFKEIYEFEEHELTKLPKNFGIGLIVGSSGSGKSLLLKQFGLHKDAEWDKEKAICSHFETYEEAVKKLMGVGFNSIPQWLVPFNILSTGQKYRVNLAREIGNNCVADEFTSVLDRGTALSLSNSLQKLIRDEGYKNIVFASVHLDIIPYLNPDWVYNTDTKLLTINDKIWSIALDEEIKFEYKDHFMNIIKV